MRVRDVIDAVRGTTSPPEPRAGSDSPRLDEATFKARYLAQFQDDAFAPLRASLDQVAEAAWDAYKHQRKSPHTQKAGPGYADPDYDLSVEWIAPLAAIHSTDRS